MGYFRFFLSTLLTFHRPVPYPIQKKITKNPLSYNLLKVKKFHCDIVKKESARAKKAHSSPNLVSRLWELLEEIQNTCMMQIIV